MLDGLFQTPTSRGMLGGAFAGGAGMCLLFVDLQSLFISGWYPAVYISLSFVQWTFMIVLPAYLARRRFSVVAPVVALVLVFVMLANGIPFWGSSALFAIFGMHVRVAYAIWYVMALLVASVMLAFALREAYQSKVPLRTAIVWSMGGSIPRVALIVAGQFLLSQDAERRALFAMAAAMCFVVHGAVAAVPFERQDASE